LSNSGTTGEILLAWGVGLAIAGVVYGPIVAASQGDGIGAALSELTMIPLFLLLSFTFGALLSLPLIVLGLVAAILLGPRPARRPVLWALGSAVIGAACYAVGDAVVRGDMWSDSPGFALRPAHPVLVADVTVIALAVFGGALFYCLRLSGRVAAGEGVPNADRGGR